MSRAAERAAKNEEPFREVNRNIVRLEERFGATQTLELICGANGASATADLRSTRTTYAEGRTSPLRFFVLPGHEDPEVEKVVLRKPSYLVVEKVGEAAREILEEDAQTDE
jgi:hypothetical protein